MARTKTLSRDTKKARLLRLLEEHRGVVSIGIAARELYGRDGELERLKVVRILAAYRAKKDDEVGRCRVRNKNVVIR